MRIPFTHKPSRPYADPVADEKSRPRYVKPPSSSNNNLVLPLNAIDETAAARVAQNQRLVFHCLGDTGGVNGTETQTAIARAMASQITVGPNNLVTNDGSNAAFLYHLGDVVYFNGVSTDYPQQFYDPYKMYPAVILAIAGNHDGDTQVSQNDPVDHEPSLYGFMQNFCDSQPHQASDYRDTVTQPYVYWTLTTSQATIIGLYGNVDGTLDAVGTVQQQSWLAQQLGLADPNKCLLLAIHQPPYSLDTEHGGYASIGGAIDEAARSAGRWPDVILSGHVHNYQRFTRTVAVQGAPNISIPYIVMGAGGYANTRKAMHKLTQAAVGVSVPVPLPMPAFDVSLRSYNEYDPGFSRISVAGDTVTFEYHVVPFDGPPRPAIFDGFSLNWRTKTLTETVLPLNAGSDPHAA